MVRIEGGRQETVPVDDGMVDLAGGDEPARVVHGACAEGEAAAGGGGRRVRGDVGTAADRRGADVLDAKGRPGRRLPGRR